jgi:hypothetical protein
MAYPKDGCSLDKRTSTRILALYGSVACSAANHEFLNIFNILAKLRCFSYMYSYTYIFPPAQCKLRSRYTRRTERATISYEQDIKTVLTGIYIEVAQNRVQGRTSIMLEWLLSVGKQFFLMDVLKELKPSTDASINAF